MSDPTNDIDLTEAQYREADALLRHLDNCYWPQKHAALVALVAERDGYLEGNKQTLRALEEANEIAKRYKRERDEARREVCRLLSKRSGMIGAYRSAKDYAAERGWLLFGGGA